jgi:multiple sugar transport system substrate-binding protein
MRQVTMHQGRQYACINTGGTLALYYNKAHLREVGLERAPRTVSELDEANRKLVQRDASGGITRMGFHHREPGWWPFLWGYYFGGSLYDPPANRALADSPQNIAAYEWVQSYPKEMGLEDVNDFRSGFGNYDSALNPFICGKLSMVMQGPWLANMINLYNPSLEYGVAPFPVADGLFDANAPIGLVDTDVLVIPRGVKDPQASMEFIAHTQRQEIVERLSTIHCKGSPLASSSEGFLSSHPNNGVRIFDDIAKSPRAFRVPPTRAWLQVRDEFVAVLDQAWNHKAPAADLLANAQRRAQAVLNRAAADAARRSEA